MPFTQISLRKGKSPDYHRELMEEVYLAMRESINIPENDRFATVTELENGNFNNSGNYLGISRWTVVGQRTRKRRFTQRSRNACTQTLGFEKKMSWLAYWRSHRKTGRLEMARLNMLNGCLYIVRQSVT